MDKEKAFKHNSNVVLECPYCEALTSNYLIEIGSVEDSIRTGDGTNFFIAKCVVCRKNTLYVEKTEIVTPSNPRAAVVSTKVLFRKILYPMQTIDPEIPKPSEYMPEDVKKLYNEARSVFNLSPRSSGALVRITLERLIKRHILTDDTGRLNDMIGKLSVTFPDYITQLMDNIRTSGNDNAHDDLSKIHDNENSKKVIKLFEFINFICRIININEESNRMFNNIPESKRKAIEGRNKRNRVEK